MFRVCSSQAAATGRGCSPHLAQLGRLGVGLGLL